MSKLFRIVYLIFTVVKGPLASNSHNKDGSSSVQCVESPLFEHFGDDFDSLGQHEEDKSFLTQDFKSAWWDNDYSQASHSNTADEHDWSQTLAEQESLNETWQQRWQENKGESVVGRGGQQSTQEGIDLAEWKEYADILQSDDWQEDSIRGSKGMLSLRKKSWRSNRPKRHVDVPDEELSEYMKMMKKSYRKSPSAYVVRIGVNWQQFVPLYLKADPTISRNQARYRLFTKLTEDIAEKLVSSNSEDRKTAVESLDNLWTATTFDMQRTKRKAIQRKLTAYFSFTHSVTASNMCRLGMPNYPVDKEWELLSDDERIYGPALKLLRKLANVEQYKRQSDRRIKISKEKKGKNVVHKADEEEREP